MIVKNGFSKSTLYFCDFETYTANSAYFKTFNRTQAYIVSCVRSNLTFDKDTMTWQANNDDRYIKVFCNANGVIEEYLNFFLSIKQIKTNKLGLHQIHYFHNGAKFDFEFILAYLLSNTKYEKTIKMEINKNEIDFDKVYYSISWSSTFKSIRLFRYVKDGKSSNKKITIEFRDSLYIFRNSVKEIAKTLTKSNIDIAKGDTIESTKRAENGLTTKEMYEDKELIEYCINDSLIVCRMFELMAKYFPNSSELPNTTPSWAVSMFLHDSTKDKCNAMKAKDYFRYEIMKLDCDTQEDYDNIYNVWYSGGLSTYRQKSLMRVVKNVYHEDVVSQYPHKMRDFYMPIGKHKEITNLDEWLAYEKQHKQELESGKFPCFVNYTYHNIKQNENVPNFLKRNKVHKGRIDIGELGTYETFLNELDLKECYLYYTQFNRLVDYDSKTFIVAYVFERSKPIFSNYVDIYYQLKDVAKQNGDEAAKIFAKLMLNSLYGKTGERQRKDEKVFVEFLDALREQLKDDFINNGSEVDELGMISITKNTNQPFSFLQIASYITSLSRYWLLKRWNEILDLGGVVHYCDTDSNFFTIPTKNKDKLIYGSKLGQWELDKDIVTNFFILAPKAYCGWDNKKALVTLATKGVGKNIVKKAIELNGIEHFTTNQPYTILDKKRVNGGLVLIEKEKTIMEVKKYEFIKQSISF